MRYQIVHYAHFNDGTGWANASIGYARALKTAVEKYNQDKVHRRNGDSIALQLVSCKLNNSNVPLPADLAPLEVKKVELNPAAFRISLQQTLPHFMSCLEGFDYNVGVAVCETDFAYTDWSEYLNMMDKVIVPSETNYDSFFRSGVLESKLDLIAYPFDLTEIERYGKLSKTHHIHPLLDGNYTFYTVSEYSKRKNFGALVRAYLAEFDPAEPVSLVIKMNGNKDALNKEIEEIKDGMKLYQDRSAYQPIITISEKLSDDGMIQLHRDFDCFVNVSHAEGWSLPTFQACAFGKQVLSAWSGGVDQFVEGISLIDSVQETCFGATDTIPFLYTAREKWQNVRGPQLQYRMRQAYECRDKFKQKSSAIINKYFSYEYIGEEFLTALGVYSCLSK